MATATILQSLNDSANQSGVTASNRRQVESFIASAAIAANDLVCLDFSKSDDGDKALFIKKADSGDGETVAAIGFALNTAAAGETCEVTIAGLHVSANVDASTDVGFRLKVSNTAGRAGIYTNTDTVPVIAYAVEADTANVATVFVIKQF
tara:strand:+ start:2062 stop:2511 length:450 start_codon:yes stop_codon:yes gene_type:complete